MFFVNAAGTCLPIATAEAIRLYYPTVAVREERAGFTSAISTKKARQYFDRDPLVSLRETGMQP